MEFTRINAVWGIKRLLFFFKKNKHPKKPTQKTQNQPKTETKLEGERASSSSPQRPGFVQRSRHGNPGGTHRIHTRAVARVDLGILLSLC